MEIKELHQLFIASKGVSTDTRKIENDTIFFALKGDNFNGNQYAKDALEKGCSYAIIDEPEYSENDKFILVENVQTTLQDLANYHRNQFDIPVIGITGSNGKTTSKELIGAVLSEKFSVLITEGNLNNHLGVPFTLLKLNATHDMAIIEMGASKPGDIKELVEIAEPGFGIITNIGAAHIEGFGSLKGVINTKKELYDFIGSNEGVLFYNSNDEILKNVLPKDSNLISYGDKGQVSGELISLNPYVNFTWTKGDFTSDLINSNLVGKYNFFNFLSAVSIGDYFGVEKEKIGQALAAYVPSNNRSQVTKTEKNTLIVDCYNANASSMRAALESFVEMDSEKKLVILGDMLELGEISEEEHLKVIEFVEQNGLQAIFVGAEFSKVLESSFKDYNAVLKTEMLDQISNTAILLKGSRGIRLENLIEYL